MRRQVISLMPDPPIHIEVEPKVHLILGLNNSRFPEANSLLIDDEILTLVDAGSHGSLIIETLKDLGHDPSDLDRIVLTHFHIDHKGYAATLYELSKCEILCHPLSDKGVLTFQGMAEYYGINRHRYYDYWKSFLEARLPHVTTDYIITGHYQDGKEISCGEVDLLPIHLPGHTIDHTCFGISGRETIFLVDIDLTRFGPWYGNDVSDIPEFKRSVERVIEMQPEVGISSHLPELVKEDLIDRLETYYSVFKKREDRIMKNISDGHNTIEKLAHVPTIYPRIPYEVYYSFEEFMLEKHVQLLVSNGDITEEDGQFSIARS
ncbi:MAG: MBL fold metallo-hydrolase [Candidatus Hodarchaeota archaeon]